MSEWRTMRDVPMEVGKLLLLWDADVGHPEVASWSNNHKCWVIGYSLCDPDPDADVVGCTVYMPSHWQPLPEPPTPA